MWLVHAKGSFGTGWLVADESLGTDWPRSSERFSTVKNGKISPTLCEDRRWCVKGACVVILGDRLTLVTGVTDWLRPPERFLSPASYFLSTATEMQQYSHSSGYMKTKTPKHQAQNSKHKNLPPLSCNNIHINLDMNPNTNKAHFIGDQFSPSAKHWSFKYPKNSK